MTAEVAPLLTVEEASFAVAGKTLLAPITLEVRPARVTGLIGPNGSGKTTLLRLLARQARPTGGSISLDGKPLQAWSARAFARTLAYLPQHPPPAPGLHVRELVALGRYPWHGALGRFTAEDAARVAEALSLTGTDVYADRAVDTLSGGERQRAWLAMLVAQNARWLLLDEPTAALDVAHQVEVLALVRKLVATRGIGAVVVLHDINMAARYSDELVALKNGRLLARGRPADIMRHDTLEAVYGLPMGVFPHPRTGSPMAYVP